MGEELKNKNEKEIAETEEEIKERRAEIDRLEAELKIEKILEKELEKNNDADMKEVVEQVKANVWALGDLITMEQNKIHDLEVDLKISELRQSVLEKKSSKIL